MTNTNDKKASTNTLTSTKQRLYSVFKKANKDDHVSEGDLIEFFQLLENLESSIMLVKSKLTADKSHRRLGDSSARPQKKKKLRPWMTKHMLWMSLFWQVLNLVVLLFSEERRFLKTDKVTIDIGVTIMLIFQVLHLIFVVATSVKLTKQLLHRTATSWFLISSYLSTVLLFAGIYSVIYRMIALSFDGVEYSDGPDIDVLIVFIRFLYFSIQTMTTVGYGDIFPALWYSSLVVSAQMLLSVTYTSIIFAQGVSLFMIHSPHGAAPTIN